MIEAIYRKAYTTKGRVEYRLSASGHAEYSDHGDDIVCAGVSTLFYTLANFLEDIGADDLNGSDSDGGEFLIECNALSTDEAVETAFRMAVLGLSLLGEQYPDNVYVEEDEDE